MNSENEQNKESSSPSIEITDSKATHVKVADQDTKTDTAPKENEYQIAKGLLSKTINAIFKIIGRFMPNISDELLLTPSDSDLIEEGLKPVVESFITKMRIKAEQFQLILLALLIFVPRIILIVANKNSAKDKKEEKPLKISAQS